MLNDSGRATLSASIHSLGRCAAIKLERIEFANRSMVSFVSCGRVQRCTDDLDDMSVVLMAFVNRT